jgi:hypothetical protein
VTTHILNDLPQQKVSGFIMTHPLVRTARSLMGMAVVLLGLSAYGCGDSASENPEATLANLSVSIGTNPATLQPFFNPATTSYTVDLSNTVTTVTVGAQPAVAGDSVTIDGQTTTNRDIDLGPPVPTESTKLVNVVVSNPPSSSRTYTVLLKRAGLAGNNSLATLLVSPGTLDPKFNANTQTYTVDVANTVGSVTITPALQDTAATMTVNGQPTNSGQARTITLGPAGQPTNIPIVVTAQNGNQKTYTVTVSRGIASNNNLSALTVSPGKLNPVFSAAITSYIVDVANSVASVTVTPSRQDPNATITVNGQPTNSGQARTITLNGPGSNTLITILVTAQNGSQKPYTITVQRAALGGNNNLSALTVSPGTLNPAFDATILNYTVNVGSNVASLTVTPTRQDPNATITVNGQPTNSGQARTITLNGAGSNTLITILVTAQNGSQKPYTITVQRAALGGNNNLLALTVSPGKLNPAFSATITSYTVDVASSVASVTVTPTRQDPNATITVNGQPTNSGQARTITLNGAGSNTLITILVTAQNGSQKLYTITVQRAALGGNNNLSALTVSPGTLNPAFDATILNYTVNVGSTVASLNVTATVQDAGSSLTINGQGASSGQPRSIPLDPPGTTTEINVVVNAPNGNPKTYQIDVIREALGGNNNLQNLSVSPGSLAPAFSAATTDYTVSVASDVSSVTVTPTLQDTNATMTINGQGASSGLATTIPLGAEGSSTSVAIVVTAPNGSQKSYAITINRAAPAEKPAQPTVAPDLISEDDTCQPDLPPNQANCFPPTSKEDNITGNKRPRFGIPPPAAGETPSLYIGLNKDSSASFDASANTLRPSADLSEGDHSITYTLTNAGGESDPSPALTVTINTTAPLQ